MVSPVKTTTAAATDLLTGVVTNVFEAVDVIALIKGGVYDDLNMTVGEALLKRSDVCQTFTIDRFDELKLMN